MNFLQNLTASVKGSLPGLRYWLVLPMVPFIVAEHLCPVGTRPRLRDYWTNLLISISTAYLSLRLGISAALCSSKLRHLPRWKPLSGSFHSIAGVPLEDQPLVSVFCLHSACRFKTKDASSAVED